MKTYAGIGARNTPPAILKQMTKIAAYLSNLGWTLRSGGATGADNAFETCAGENKEIYLPWPGYNGKRSAYSRPSTEALLMASSYHPNWHACSQGVRKLHARNCHIVLGPLLDDPVDMIICWTPGGLRGGGTGQALRMTKDYPQIAVYDLAVPETIEILRKKLIR